MARKLDAPNEREPQNDQSLRFGRRDYVKAGVLSTVAGAALVGSTIPAAGRSTQSIHVVGTGDLSSYEVTVSGSLTDAVETTVGSGGHVSGRNAEGVVAADIHGYEYEGEVVDVRVEGDATVYLDGSPIDASSFDD